MSNSFESILDRPVTEIDRPTLIPVGTYACIIKNQPEEDKTRTGTDMLRFVFWITAPTEDVSEDDLRAALTREDGSLKSLQEISVRHQFWTTPSAAYRLFDFLSDDLGIDGGSKKNPKSLRDMLMEVIGKEFLAHVVHNPSQDGKTTWANVDRTMPLG